jgi:uncharacterized membrane protein YeaQ/YmgE (transglycosylase-associated protein family)
MTNPPLEGATTVSTEHALNVTARPRPIASWRRTAFDGGGYFFKQAAAATLIIGLYLHLVRLQIADDAYVFAHVVTPTVDKIFAVVMTYAAVTGWLTRRYVVYTGPRQKIIFTVILGYITASLPVHYATYLTNSTKLLAVFPLWYSALFMAVVGALLVFVWRLRIRRPTTIE